MLLTVGVGATIVGVVIKNSTVVKVGLGLIATDLTLGAVAIVADKLSDR